MTLTFRRAVIFAVFSGIGLIFAGGVREASAQIPTNGVFYACVRLDWDADEGQLIKLVAADERCGAREKRVQWNAAGIPGPQGPTGATGAPGPAGTAGPMGPAGPQGSQGLPGPMGPTGATGPQGQAGSQGPKGDTGTTGATGPQGSAGADGAKGADGAPGAKGDKGDKGDTGATGSAGAVGNTGAQGISVAMETVAPGTPDCAGSGGVMLTLVDEHGSVVSESPQYVCDGAVGAQGPQGAPGPSGTTGQSSTTLRSTATPSPSTISAVGLTCFYPSGFPLVVEVPANADTVVSIDGAVSTATSTTITDVFLEIDGSNATGGNFLAYRRLYATPSAPVTSWSITRRVSLTPGSHSINVCHQLTGLVTGGVVTYTGPSGPGNLINFHLQTVATVTFVKK